MNTYKKIGSDIDNTAELSSVCRGEWCRSLESEIDNLDLELHDYTRSGEVNERFCMKSILNKIHSVYRNIRPDIRVLSK